MGKGNGDGCAACAKWSLFVFNGLFLLIGIALLAVGVYVYVAMRDSFSAFSSEINIPAIIIIVLGSLTVVITFLGCCGAFKQSPCMLFTFASIILILLTAEIVIGALVLVYHNQAEDFVGKVLQASLSEYGQQDTITKAWDEMQSKMECCGVKGPSDWTGATRPASCGSATEGCLVKLTDEVQANAIYIGAVAIAVALVQVIGVVLAFCLGCSARKGYSV